MVTAWCLGLHGSSFAAELTPLAIGLSPAHGFFAADADADSASWDGAGDTEAWSAGVSVDSRRARAKADRGAWQRQAHGQALAVSHSSSHHCKILLDRQNNGSSRTSLPYLGEVFNSTSGSFRMTALVCPLTRKRLSLWKSDLLYFSCFRCRS